MARFYGAIPLFNAFEIISHQNPELITVAEFSKFSVAARYDPDIEFCVLRMDEIYDDVPKEESADMMIVDGFLASEATDTLYYILDAQSDKPYCVPDKELLLKYSEELYYELTPQAEKLMDFLRPRTKHAHSIEDAMCFLTYNAKYEAPNCYDFLDELRKDIDFNSEDEVLELLNLYNDFCNNIRLPYNRGYTPIELRRMYSHKNIAAPQLSIGPNMCAMLKSGELSADDLRKDLILSDMPDDIKISLLKELYKISPPRAENKAVSKVGRNDPCPCGSGKKYKKCCGR